MKYLLILFIIALALAPLTHFLPSKRQRKVAGLREYAAVHGLFVEFRKLPGSEREAVQARTPRGDIIYYGKRLPPPRRGEARRGRWVRDSVGWVNLDQGVALPVPVAELADMILAASVDDGSCGIYWQESGSEQEVEQIRQVLEAWSAQLPG